MGRTMEKERDYQYDNMKAILIFCVVLGHVISNFGRTPGADILYNIIFSFHMPAFLFVSGYFSKYNPKRAFASLFPLYALFQIIQYLERGILASVGTGQIKMGGFDFFTPQWTLWYLVALMAFQLLLPVFDTDDRKKQGAFLLLALVLGLLVGFTPDTDNFLAMSRVFVFLPFYLWGYYEHKNQILRRLRRWKYFGIARAGAVITAAVLIIGFCLFDNRIVAKNFYGTEQFLDVGMIIGRVFAWATSILGILILIIWVPERKLGYLGTIGSRTLPVYLFHSLVILILERTPLGDLMNGNLIWLLILSAALTFLLSWGRLETLLRKIQISQRNR